MAGTLARACCERQGDEKTGILVGHRAVSAAAVEARCLSHSREAFDTTISDWAAGLGAAKKMFVNTTKKSQPLTAETKAQIRAEEVFREEVRKELSAEQHRAGFWSGIWHFMNSAFGLWFLSSVVLGVGVWAFTTLSEKLHAERESVQKVWMLKEEIVSDFWDFSQKIKTASKFADYNNAFNDHLVRPAFSHFSDFKGKTLDELLWLLGTYPPEVNPRKAKDVKSKIAKIWSLITRLNESESISPDQKVKVDSEIETVLEGDVFPLLTP